MNIRKRHLALLIAGIAIVGFAALSYSWTYTPYGRLDYRAALSTHLTLFSITIQPDPKSDFTLHVPLNPVFAVSAILPEESIGGVKDIDIPGKDVKIPARVYWPEGKRDARTLPVIVYFHGGGFVLGDVKLFDALARSLSNATGALVISVDYRKGPLHPYPAAVDDCYAALLWAGQNTGSLGGDVSKLMVAGDSAGGNLATVVALKAAAEHGPPIVAQLLYYPVTDLTDKRYASKERFGDGYGLSKEEAKAFNRAYMPPGTDTRNPYLSPLYASSLAHLPPVLVFTGGFDPLTDGTKAYIARLKQDGVAVTWHYYPEMIHGFMSVPLFWQRREALDQTRDFLAALFASPAK